MAGRRFPLSLCLGIGILLSAVHIASAAQDVEPYVACVDGECDITNALSRQDLELTVGDAMPMVFPADGDPEGDVACLEEIRGCVVRDPGMTVADIGSAYDGRVIFGAVDADPTGGWTTENLKAKMRCKPSGSKAVTATLKPTTDHGRITRDVVGALTAQSDRRDQAPCALLRMSPGVYVSIQRFTEAGIKGDMVSYYGTVSGDEIKGTSIVDTTVRRGGVAVTCKMDRDFDMVRTDGPDAPPAGGDGSDGPNGGDDQGSGEGAEGAAMVFEEAEVEDDAA